MTTLFNTTFSSTNADFTLSYNSSQSDFSTQFGTSGSAILRPATTTTLGGIIVGDNLTITTEGRLSAEPGVVWEVDL